MVSMGTNFEGSYFKASPLNLIPYRMLQITRAFTCIPTGSPSTIAISPTVADQVSAAGDGRGGSQGGGRICPGMNARVLTRGVVTLCHAAIDLCSLFILISSSNL